MAKNGAEAIIMGCTEITILIESSLIDVIIFDTAEIHVEQILKEMFNDN